MAISMIHTALVLTCGHVIPGKEWQPGEQVRAYCPEHGLKDVVAREVVA